MNNQLVSIEMETKASEFGIEKDKIPNLVGDLPQIQSERAEFQKQYDEVIKMDIENPQTSKIARELRIKIKDNRTKGILVWHKRSKDYFLKGGQFVDAIRRKEEAINERMEESLEEIEKYLEKKIAKEKEILKENRISQIRMYSEFVPFGIDFAEISDEEFKKVFNGARLQYEADLLEKQKVEEERLENERIEKIAHQNEMALLPYKHYIQNWDNIVFRSLIQEEVNILIKDAIKERDRVQKESEEAKKRAEEAESKMKEERLKAERERQEIENKLKKEREENEKLLLEIKRKKDEEDKRLAEEKKKERNLKNASDKNVLMDIANNIENIDQQYPKMKGDEAKVIMNESMAYLKKVASFIRSNAEGLTK